MKENLSPPPACQGSSSPLETLAAQAQKKAASRRHACSIKLGSVCINPRTIRTKYYWLATEMLLAAPAVSWERAPYFEGEEEGTPVKRQDEIKLGIGAWLSLHGFYEWRNAFIFWFKNCRLDVLITSTGGFSSFEMIDAVKQKLREKKIQSGRFVEFTEKGDVSYRLSPLGVKALYEIRRKGYWRPHRPTCGCYSSEFKVTIARCLPLQSPCIATEPAAEENAPPALPALPHTHRPPRQTSPRTANHDRDRKAYELAVAGMPWKEIVAAINREAPTWETVQAAIHAVKRFAEGQGLPLPPPRRRGCPRRPKL